MGDRVTTSFPDKQYAHVPKASASFTAPDVTVDRIGDLLAYDLSPPSCWTTNLDTLERNAMKATPLT